MALVVRERNVMIVVNLFLLYRIIGFFKPMVLRLTSQLFNVQRLFTASNKQFYFFWPKQLMFLQRNSELASDAQAFIFWHYFISREITVTKQKNIFVLTDKALPPQTW
jgi:hypothetical protein